MSGMLDLKLYGIALSCLSLIGCVVGPDFQSPDSPKTNRYTERPQPKTTVSTEGQGGNAQYFLASKDIPAEWWKVFRSKTLNNLICRGLKNSPNLQAAQAALVVAEQNWLAQIGSSFFPAFSLQGGVTRERLSLAGANTTQAAAATTTSAGTPAIINKNPFTLYNASVNVSYTLDIFGAARRTVEALHALVDYQCFQKEAAFLSLTSNIVTTVFAEASLRAQIATTHELIRLTADQLKIIQQQFQLGAVSRSDVLAQETQLATLQASLPPLEKNLSLQRHALAVLVGELPSESELPNFNLNDFILPSKLPISVPAMLVRQRPDVRAAEALLHQASANIGVATANLLPQVNIVGDYGGQAFFLKNLLSTQARAWTIGIAATQPIFQGGALITKRRAAHATFDQVCAQYRQTVLQAFQNVADALRALEMDAKTLKANTEAESAALASYTLAKKQFELGAVNYLTLLNSEQKYQQTRINRIQALALRYTDTAALFQALGGGWWNRC